MTNREKIDDALAYIRGQQTKDAKHRAVTHRPEQAQDRSLVGERQVEKPAINDRTLSGGLIREEHER